MQEEFWKVSAGEDEKAAEKLRAGGMTVEEAPPAVVEAMQAAAHPVWGKTFERIGPPSKELIAAYLEKIGRK